MTTVSLNQLQAGMVLTQDVKHANGRVLLRAGSGLTEQHIKIFKTWGVAQAEIKSPDDESTELSKQYSQERINAVESEQRRNFSHCDLEHPFMAELFSLSIKRALARREGRH